MENLVKQNVPFCSFAIAGGKSQNSKVAYANITLGNGAESKTNNRNKE